MKIKTFKNELKCLERFTKKAVIKESKGIVSGKITAEEVMKV